MLPNAFDEIRALRRDESFRTAGNAIGDIVANRIQSLSVVSESFRRELYNLAISRYRQIMPSDMICLIVDKAIEKEFDDRRARKAVAAATAKLPKRRKAW